MEISYARRLQQVLFAVIVLGLGGAATARADQVVQVPMNELLNVRPVATLTGGVFVPWVVGLSEVDGFITLAAALSLKQAGPALPDDGKVAANARHPEVVLNFSNAAPADSQQAHQLKGVGTFAFAVPAATYSKVILFFSSAYGDSQLAMTMTYADGTTSMTKLTLPDFGLGGTLPPTCFLLVAGLHKWNKQGMSDDTPTHTIAGVELSPTADKVLTHVEVNKTSAAQTLTFWGATGVATGSVDSGTPDGGGVTDGGAGGEAMDAVVDAGAMDQGKPVDAVDVAAVADAAAMDASAGDMPGVVPPSRRSVASSGCAISAGGGQALSWILLLSILFGERRGFGRRRTGRP
jgi:hypothetical protein